MGQVFTWDAIQSGRIPKKEDFRHIAMLLRTAFRDEPSIASALLFGSVVRGDSTIRSDVDCVVVYKAEQEWHAIQTMHAVGRVAHTLHVPVNFTSCDTAVAGTRFHHLGTSFVQHLQAAADAGGVIKGNLVSLLAPTITLKEEIESYIRMKMFGVQTAFTQMASFSEEDLMRFLRKALEAPMHVARKMLIYENALRGDSKKEVRERYQEAMPSGLGAQFNELLDLDSWYTEDLESQLKKPNKDRYLLTIAELEEEVPTAVLAFLRANILRLSNAC